MSDDPRFRSERFPRSSRYNPDWIIANCASGANSLWTAEWLSSAMDLRPGMRVLDLGCGRAMTSIFLAREFGVEVWAADLWMSATENLRRIQDVGLTERVLPFHADARSLPFAGDFFDAVVSIDAYSYFGTDDLYLNYLAHFAKPGCQLGIAGAGIQREIEGPVPQHLRQWWTQDLWSLHSAAWWRRHWERTGIVEVEVADMMPDGGKAWLEWHTTAYPENRVEIEAIEADRGEYMGFVRLVARRRANVRLEDYCWPDTLRVSVTGYEKKPLLRE
jgi:SAM-dependent methyltransferase